MRYIDVVLWPEFHPDGLKPADGIIRPTQLTARLTVLKSGLTF